MLPFPQGEKTQKRSMQAKKKKGGGGRGQGGGGWQPKESQLCTRRLPAAALSRRPPPSHAAEFPRESGEHRDAAVWQWPLPRCLALSRHPLYQISVRATRTLLTAPNTPGNTSRHSPRWRPTATSLPLAIMLTRPRPLRPERPRPTLKASSGNGSAIQRVNAAARLSEQNNKQNTAL